MQFKVLAVATSAFALVACGGGEKKAEDTAAVAPAVESPAAAAPAAAAGAVAASPITGQMHSVNMIGDEKGYRFEPATLTVKAGDGVKFVSVKGGPHNVAFDPAEIMAAAKPQLMANMDNQMSELSGQLLSNPNETYEISFANVPAGKYNYHCTPHLAMNMRGVITVE